MTQTSAHKSNWQTTDAIIIVILLIGFVLEHYIFSFSKIPVSNVFRFCIGGLLLMIGITIIILAKKAFISAGQPSGPGRPTTKIVDHGIFRYSRNPLYLGNVLTLIGVGVIFSNMWYIFLSIPFAIMIHFVLILPEERYLAKLFATDYKAYGKRVRRWI